MESCLIEKVMEMRISGKKIPVESRFMTDFWALRKKYYTPEDQDEFWIALDQDADGLYQKYKKNEYVKKMILALVDDIEKRYRKVYKSMEEQDGMERLQ